MIVTFHFSKKINGWVFGSKFIMWVEGSDYSHCATEIQMDPDAEPFVYEAVYPKSRRLLKSAWLQHAQPVHSIPFLVTNEAKKEEIINILHDNLDKGYSVAQLIVISIGMFFKTIQKAVDKIILNSNRYLICSEYQSLALRAMGAQFEEPSDSVDLTECYDAAMKLKGL